MSDIYTTIKVYNYATKDVTEYNNVRDVTSKNKMVQFTMRRGILISDAIIRLSPAIITFSEETLRNGDDKI